MKQIRTEVAYNGTGGGALTGTWAQWTSLVISKCSLYWVWCCSRKWIHLSKLIYLWGEGILPQLKLYLGTSLVAQCLRICLPMQGTWVRALVWEDTTCCRATKPMCHNYWACTLETTSHNYRAHAPQLLKPVYSNEDPMQPKINK